MLVKINVTKSIAVPAWEGKERTKDLVRGVHEVDDSILSHPRMQALIKAKIVTITKGKPKVFTPANTVVQHVPMAPQIEEIKQPIPKVVINDLTQQPPKEEIVEATKAVEVEPKIKKRKQK